MRTETENRKGETMWRAHENHQTETLEVRKALKVAGVPVKKVGHGKGTGWAWLKVTLARSGKTHETIGPDGYVVEMTDTQRQHADSFPRCVYDCPACQEDRKMEKLAYGVILDTTGRGSASEGQVVVTS